MKWLNPVYWLLAFCGEQRPKRYPKVRAWAWRVVNRKQQKLMREALEELTRRRH